MYCFSSTHTPSLVAISESINLVYLAAGYLSIIASMLFFFIYIHCLNAFIILLPSAIFHGFFHFIFIISCYQFLKQEFSFYYESY